MRNALLSTAVLLALALAGCQDDDGGHTVEPVTCPDGTVLSPEDIETLSAEHGTDHHAEGFNATALCPVPPSVTLEGIPATLQAFKTAPFRWSLDNGSLHHAHSMLTSIRYSATSVPASDLTAVTKYPSELIKREHQDLPVSYAGNLSFSKVGKVYLRAYAQIQGADYWSDEVELEITPVPPSGVVHTVTKGAGDFLVPPSPATVSAKLGDAVVLDNQDPAPRTCNATNGPAQVDPLSAEGASASNEVVFVVPGTYTFSCDTVQPTSFAVNVSVQ